MSRPSNEFDALVAALTDSSASVRYRAVEALGGLRDPRATVPLCGALRDADAWVRRSAAQALGTTADPSSVEALIEALRDPDRWVRGRVAEALACIGDTRAVPALIEALESSVAAHSWVARALGALGDARAVPSLLRALNAGDGAMRGHAAAALGALGDPRAVVSLVAALQDSDDYVRERAAWALGELAQGQPAPGLKAALVPLRRLASPWSDESDTARPVFREALRRIEAAANGSADYPFPAAGPSPLGEELPVPVMDPQWVSNNLLLPAALPPPVPVPIIRGFHLFRQRLVAAGTWLRRRHGKGRRRRRPLCGSD